jgi:DNA-binding response OmpR family regulator
MIMIAMNNPIQSGTMAIYLQDDGYKTRECNSGKKVLEYINSLLPALILSDLTLTDMNGIELCWRIRETSRHPNVPFILLIENDDPEIRINGLRSGVDAFVRKNASRREILTNIEAILNRHKNYRRRPDATTPSLFAKMPDFTLIEILQILNLTHKSGTLRIMSEKETGEIGLQDGKLLWANAPGKSEGEAAIAEMVLLDNISFEFDTNQVQEKANIQRPTMEIILTCCSLLDEKRLAMENKPIPPEKSGL